MGFFLLIWFFKYCVTQESSSVCVALYFACAVEAGTFTPYKLPCGFKVDFHEIIHETYADIDAIAGATITTNGYKTAVLKSFEAVEILKGGV